MSHVRKILKRGVEQMLSSSAAGAIARHRIRGKRLILAYHGIVPEGSIAAGERALFIAQREFARQLDMLAAIADVAPLDHIDEPGDGRPRVAITFDDAYRGAVNEGVRELGKRGLPATIFVAPGRLNGHVFWWDALADKPSALDEKLRLHAVHALGGSDERVHNWARRRDLVLANAFPNYVQTASHAELRDALAVPGISVGSHSWSHPNLTALNGSDLAMEVERSRHWLVAEFGDRAIPWLAYPYGLESEETRRAVANASYLGALRIGGGWHRADEVSAFARPRLSIPGNLSLDGFRARLLGVMAT